MSTDRPSTTISGAIRKRLTEIERRMYEGERQSDIVAQLNSEGIKVSLKDFRQLLYRAKKARKRLEDSQRTSGVIADKEIPETPSDTATKENINAGNKENDIKEEKHNTDSKPAGKMSLADIDKMLKNPLDLDNL